MATYYNISRDEMHAFLTARGFVPMKLEGVQELVYGKRVDQNNKPLTLRVYTGINPSGASRGVGEDAIRVALFVLFRKQVGFNHKTNEPIWTMQTAHVGGDKRVHRVEGWAKNLANRLDTWQEGLPDHDCPKCGSPLTIRKGKYGPFAGCAAYNIKVNGQPSCKYIERI